MDPTTIALIALEILKMINWNLEHLSPEDAQKAAARGEAFLEFWQHLMPTSQAK